MIKVAKCVPDARRRAREIDATRCIAPRRMPRENMSVLNGLIYGSTIFSSRRAFATFLSALKITTRDRTHVVGRRCHEQTDI